MLAFVGKTGSDLEGFLLSGGYLLVEGNIFVNQPVQKGCKSSQKMYAIIFFDEFPLNEYKLCALYVSL